MQNPRPKIRVAAALSVLIATCAQAPAVEAADVRKGPSQSPCPDLLLHASFDRKGHTDLNPIQETHGRRGKAGRYPNANYARGSRVPLVEKSLMIDQEGRFGQAVRLRNGPQRDQHGELTFDGKRNLNLRRGTVCFWLKPWPRFNLVAGQRRGVLLWLGQHSWPHRTAALQVEVRGDDTFRFTAKDRDHGERQFRVAFKLDPFKIGQWMHLAFVWDEIHGMKVYRDGKPIVERWDTSDKTPWHRAGTVDSIGVGCRHWGAQHRSSAHDASYDEFYVFGRPLAEAEIQGLYRKNELPMRPVEEKSDVKQFARHRLEQIGWQDTKGVPEVQCNARKVFRVEDVFVQKTLAVKIDARAPVDGKRMTAWPLEYHGYSTGGKRLRFDLGRLREVNYIRVVGSIGGRFLCNDKPVGDLLTRRPAGVQRLAFPIKMARQWTIERKDGRVTDCWFYRLRPDAGEMASEGRVEFAFSAGAPERVPEDVETYRTGNFLPEDRDVVSCAPRAKPGELKVRALRYWHLLLPAFGEDTAVAGLTLDLALRDFPQKTLLAVFMMDPVTRLRRAFDFDVLALHKDEGTRRLKVCLDTQDFMLRKGAQILLTLVADADGTLLCGPDGSKAVVHTTTREKALKEYYHNQIMVAKNVYGNIVENSPGKMRRDIPYYMSRGLQETVDLLADLHHYVQTDDLYGFMDFVHRQRLSYTWAAAPKYFSPPRYAPKFEDPKAPEWANWVRLAHRLGRRIPEWWSDNRQIENGELGGYYGDDTDFIQGWVDFALLSDDDHKLRDSYRLLADYVWNEKMANGLNIKARDHLHSYEEGPNLQGKLGVLYYGEPEYVERHMLTSSRYPGWLIAKNKRGQMLFRSWAFGDKAVRTTGTFGYDICCCLILEPGFYLSWYNNHPNNERLFKAWMDTWLAVADPNEPWLWTKPLKWETGRPDPPLPQMRGHSTYYLCYRLAQRYRDARYFEPFKPGRRDMGAAKYVRFRKVLREFVEPKVLAQWDGQLRKTWTEAAEARDDVSAAQLKALGERVPAKTVEPSVALLDWHLTKDKKLIPSVLRSYCRRNWLWYPAYTWLEMSPDRIGISTNLLSDLMLGGAAGMRAYLYPMISVSWEGADVDVARLVIDDYSDRLKVALYNFAPQARQVTMRVWRLRSGEYNVRIGPDADGDDTIDKPAVDRTERLFKYAPVRISLPSRTPYLAECRLLRELDPVEDRCDLAIGHKDVVYDAKTDSVTVTVHSLGCKPTPEATLLVTGEKGLELLRAVVPPMQAPLDFKPRTARFVARNVKAKGATRIRAAVDPEGKVAEITDENNGFEIVLRRADQK